MLHSSTLQVCLDRECGSRMLAAPLRVGRPMGAMLVAAGLLTGKYQNGAVPEGSRKSIVPAMGGRISDRVFEATGAYLDIAQRHGLDPVHMALAWCRTRPFMASAIFGATTFEQLEVALASVDVTLSDEVMQEIAAAHKAHPMPY